MNRQPIKTAPALFAALMPQLSEIAKQCGYALTVHGTMTHDLDLVAIPWVHNALPAEELVERIRDHVYGYIDTKGKTAQSPSPEQKVHGRVAWCIYFSRQYIGLFIDLSVMPRIDPNSGKVCDVPIKSRKESA